MSQEQALVGVGKIAEWINIQFGWSYKTVQRKMPDWERDGIVFKIYTGRPKRLKKCMWKSTFVAYTLKKAQAKEIL